jgi:hypothetical protein
MGKCALQSCARDPLVAKLWLVNRFLLERKREIMGSIGERTVMVVSALPAILGDQPVLDMSDDTLRAMIAALPRLSARIGEICLGQPSAAGNGLRAEGTGPEAAAREYVEVFLNGYIEYGKPMEKKGELGLFFAGIADAGSIVNFMALVQNVCERYLTQTPVVVSFVIYNARDMWLADSEFSKRDSQTKWQLQHLELGKFHVADISQERPLVTKTICDRLWQAFGREKAIVFGDDGTFLIGQFLTKLGIAGGG